MEVARDESGAEALDRVRSGLAARNDGRQGRLDRKDLEVRPMFLEELRDAGDVAAGDDAGDQHVDRRILEVGEAFGAGGADMDVDVRVIFDLLRQQGARRRSDTLYRGLD